MIGSEGTSGKKTLDSEKGKSLQRGKTDVFTLTFEDVGIPRQLRVGHDLKGFFSDWHLAEITVACEKRGEFLFPCNAWIGKDVESGAVMERLLDTTTVLANVSGVGGSFHVEIETADIKGASTTSEGKQFFSFI